MKKNKMMRVASLLLVAVLLSTSVISGTFAKYVSEGGVEDLARVAKWGVTITGQGTLFADTYIKGTNTPGAKGADPATLSVVSNTTGAAIEGVDGKDKVVAPGTKNDTGLTITVAGTPEVDGVIKMNVRNANGDEFNAAKDDIYLKAGTYALMTKVTITEDNFKANTFYTLSSGSYTLADSFAAGTDYYALHDQVVLTGDYYPVRYKLNGADVSDNLAESSLGKLISSLGTDGEVAFKANTSLANVPLGGGNGTVNVTWEWKFENGTADANTGKRIYDGADTILGHLAAGLTAAGDACVVKVSGTSATVLTNQTDYNITSGIQILLSVTQVD